MKYQITEYDKELLLQRLMQYRIRIHVTNKDKRILAELSGISNVGGIHIDADSDIRRTFSFTMQLERSVQSIETEIANWIGLYYEIEIGVLDLRTNEYVYYPNGRFFISDASTVYDAQNNSISFNLSDRMIELDGTRNGQIGGSPIISIPQKKEDGTKNTIRDVTVNLLKSATEIDEKHYNIDDIGEFYGMEQNYTNMEDCEDYRKKHDEWNILPFDLEYSNGTCLSEILFEIRDLYPNCQIYFDVYDNFCFNMIPSLDNDTPDLDNAYLQKILCAENSESVSYSPSDIKNVTEIFGRAYTVERFSESAVCEDNTYILSLESYDNYVKYEKIAFVSPENNASSPCLKINGLDSIPIYKEYTDTFIEPDTLLSGEMCVIEIYKTDDAFAAYYLGQYQPHVLCVLTNDKNDETYSTEYFSQKYNVDAKNILFREESFSPFCIQRKGEILDSRSGDDFDNILSNTVAIENAKYYNRISSTMLDVISITTKLIPWLDVNVKVNYKKANEEKVFSYVVKSIQNDFENGTSEITMCRFMQLYE